MNTCQEQLLRILKLVIHGEVPTSKSFSDINGEELYDLAVQQDVCAFLYPIINKYSEEIKLDEQTLHRWNMASLFIITRQLSMINGVNEIFDLFRSNGIPAISLKGLALRQLYPQPELRNMGDIDLLINEKDMQKSIELMSTLGYRPNSMNMNDPDYMHIDMYKEGSFPVELHRTLWHSKHMRRNDNLDWLNHIWENKRMLKVEGIQFTALSLEDELINLVVHIARHLKHSDANLRQLCDITLFLNANRSNMDYRYIDQTIKAMNLFTFYLNLIATCHIFLGLKIPISGGSLEIKKSIIIMKYIFNSKIVSQNTDIRKCWRKIIQQFIRQMKIILNSITYTKKLLKYIEPLRSRARFLRSIGLHLRYY